MAAALSFTHHVLLPVQAGFGFQNRCSSKHEHVLWYITDGALRVRLAEHQWHDLGPHSCVWFAPELPHSVETTAQQVFTAYSFRFQGKMPIRDHKLQVQAGATLPFIDALYRECLLDGLSDQQRLHALLYIIATSFDAPVSEQASSLSMQQRQQLAKYVQTHVQYKVQPADLAQHLGYSADYFSRLFKRSYGRSPKRWLMEQRVSMAQYHLRNSNLPMLEVAACCGYDDQNIFSRQFKQVMGCSPTAFRQQI